MKKFIIFYLVSIVILTISTSNFAYCEYEDVELLIANVATNNVELYIKLYPIGSVFNGPILNTAITHYSPLSVSITPEFLGVPRKGGGPLLKYLVGLDGYALSNISYEGFFKLNYSSGPNITNHWCILGHDAGGNHGAMDGLIGYAKYRLEIYVWDGDSSLQYRQICDPILIDWSDFKYGLNTIGMNADVIIRIRHFTFPPNSSYPPNITYQWNYPTAEDEILYWFTGNRNFVKNIMV